MVVVYTFVSLLSSTVQWAILPKVVMFLLKIAKIFGQFVHEDITMPCLYLIWSMIVVIWVLRFIIILPRRQMTDWWLYIVVITSELVITINAPVLVPLTDSGTTSVPGLAEDQYRELENFVNFSTELWATARPARAVDWLRRKWRWRTQNYWAPGVLACHPSRDKCMIQSGLVLTSTLLFLQLLFYWEI